MISALLGAVGLPGERPSNLEHHVPSSGRTAHVLNLLELAFPNAALSTYRQEYERELQGALFPQVSAAKGRNASKRSRSAKRKRGPKASTQPDTSVGRPRRKS